MLRPNISSVQCSPSTQTTPGHAHHQGEPFSFVGGANSESCPLLFVFFYRGGNIISAGFQLLEDLFPPLPPGVDYRHVPPHPVLWWPGSSGQVQQPTNCATPLVLAPFSGSKTVLPG